MLRLLAFAFTLALAAQQPDDLFRAAVEAQQRGDLETAIRDYRELLKMRPNAPAARANLGAALAHLGRFEEAIAEDRLALRLEPGNDAIRMNLGLAFYKQGQWQNAAGEFDQIYKHTPVDTRVVTLLGDCELHLGKVEDAVRLAVPVAKAHPENLDLAFVAGSALIRAGKRRDGLVFIERVAREQKSADAYVLAGSTWLDVNEFQAARRDLEAALELNPTLPGVHTLLGMALDKGGDATTAEAEFRRALEEKPDDFQANLYLGAILYKRRDLDEARKFLERALKLDSSSALARFEFAQVESASGQLAEAVSDLQYAAKTDPHWLEPHVQLAALYYKLHRPQEGAKEREIVDKLEAEQQKKGPQ